MITLWGCCIHISQFRWVLDPSFPLFYRLCFFRHPSVGHNTLCAQNPECTRVHFILQWMEGKRGRKGISRTNISGSRSSPRHPSSQRVLYVFWIHAFKLCLIVFWKCYRRRAVQKMVWPLKRKEKEKLSRCVVAVDVFWWGRVAVFWGWHVLMRQGGGASKADTGWDGLDPGEARPPHPAPDANKYHHHTRIATAFLMETMLSQIQIPPCLRLICELSASGIPEDNDPVCAFVCSALCCRSHNWNACEFIGFDNVSGLFVKLLQNWIH